MSTNQDEMQLSAVDKIDIIKGSASKGIFYGAIIDIVGSLLVSILFGFVYTIILLRQGVPVDEITARLTVIEHWSLPMLVGMAVGMLISFYAGYVCAKKSRTNLDRNASLLSLISCSFGFLVGYNIYSLPENILFSVLTVVVIFLGSNYWKKKNL